MTGNLCRLVEAEASNGIFYHEAGAVSTIFEGNFLEKFRFLIDEFNSDTELFFAKFLAVDTSR